MLGVNHQVLSSYQRTHPSNKQYNQYVSLRLWEEDQSTLSAECFSLSYPDTGTGTCDLVQALLMAVIATF